jgi:hypothetical protein
VKSTTIMTSISSLSQEYTMKKIVIAVLTIVGAAALIKVVSDRLND